MRFCPSLSFLGAGSLAFLCCMFSLVLSGCGGSDQETCRLTVINLEEEIPSSINCTQGTFTISNSSISVGWHGQVSRIDVPALWTVVVEHEEFTEESMFMDPVPGTEGWVKLPEGRTNLDQFSSELYVDMATTVPTGNSVRVGGMNDAVRKIFINPSSNATLTIFKDSIGDSPEKISITFELRTGQDYPETGF